MLRPQLAAHDLQALQPHHPQLKTGLLPQGSAPYTKHQPSIITINQRLMSMLSHSAGAHTVSKQNCTHKSTIVCTQIACASYNLAMLPARC